MRAVGWLEADRPYRRGAVSAKFLAALKAHVARAYQPVLFMGFHRCSLCPEGQHRAGYHNLLIPMSELLFVAPALVVHSVDDHGYQPPEALM